jgi:hypothetical protein
MSTGLFRSYKTWQKNFINGESAVLWRGTTRYDYKIDQGDVANTNLSGCEAKGEQPKPTTQNKRIEHLRSGWEQFPTQSPICGGDDGLPTELDGITFSKWRNESIKAYGNAIVPQVAYEIFKAIEATIQGVD